MVKKEFTYRGRTVEQLKALSINELAELFPADQRRKIKKGFTEQEKILLEKIRSKKTNIETHCRDMLVLPEMIGMRIKIHYGKGYEDVMITEDMIGHRFGEFAMTRKGVKHNAPGIGATKSSASLSVK